MYKKALGLKAYIDDYSLMKERSLDSSIIWDDYLTYAIAFGISNKVTDLLGENIMKTNMLLQNIEKTLRFQGDNHQMVIGIDLEGQESIWYPRAGEIKGIDFSKYDNTK